MVQSADKCNPDSHCCQTESMLERTLNAPSRFSKKRFLATSGTATAIAVVGLPPISCPPKHSETRRVPVRRPLQWNFVVVSRKRVDTKQQKRPDSKAAWVDVPGSEKDGNWGPWNDKHSEKES